MIDESTYVHVRCGTCGTAVADVNGQQIDTWTTYRSTRGALHRESRADSLDEIRGVLSVGLDLEVTCRKCLRNYPMRQVLARASEGRRQGKTSVKIKAE